MDGPLQFESEEIIAGKLSEEQRARFYELMSRTIVKVDVYDTEHKEYDWEGAGVFISEEGHILTLSHIFDESTIVRVTTKDEITYNAYIFSIDKSLGLAILLVYESNVKFPYVKICENIVLGEEVYPIGHPSYLGFSYPVGHVSFCSRTHRELCESLSESVLTNNMLIDRYNTSPDPSAKHICYVENLEDLHGLSPSVYFVQVNNVHGDSMHGASGMALFNYRGELIGIYYLMAYDQAFGIHGKTLNHYVKRGD